MAVVPCTFVLPSQLFSYMGRFSEFYIVKRIMFENKYNIFNKNPHIFVSTNYQFASKYHNGILYLGSVVAFCRSSLQNKNLNHKLRKK